MAKKGHIPWNKGIPRTKEVKEKLRLANKGRKMSQDFKDKISHATRGNKNPRWNGGKVRSIKGYILVHKPEHPFCNCRGYVYKHRIVVEKQIGRYLTEEEIVHHTGRRDDNRPKKLICFSDQASHVTFEAGMAVPSTAFVFDGRELKKEGGKDNGRGNGIIKDLEQSLKGN